MDRLHRQKQRDLRLVVWIRVVVKDGFHTRLYKNGLTPIDHEFLGLYVLANGCVRISGHRRLIAASYLVEAAWAWQNGYDARWDVTDAWFVGSLSLLLFWYVDE